MPVWNTRLQGTSSYFFSNLLVSFSGPQKCTCIICLEKQLQHSCEPWGLQAELSPLLFLHGFLLPHPSCPSAFFTPCTYITGPAWHSATLISGAGPPRLLPSQDVLLSDVLSRSKRTEECRVRPWIMQSDTIMGEVSLRDRGRFAHTPPSLVTNIKWFKPQYSRFQPRLPKMLQDLLIQIFSSAVSNLHSILWSEGLLREALDYVAMNIVLWTGNLVSLSKTWKKKATKFCNAWCDCCAAHFSPAASVQQSSQLTNVQLEQT